MNLHPSLYSLRGLLTDGQIIQTKRPGWHTCGTLHTRGFPGGASGKEPACQCRRWKRCRFDPLVGNIPWRRARQSTPVFCPEESPGQRKLVGCSLGGSQSWAQWERLSARTWCFIPSPFSTLARSSVIPQGDLLSLLRTDLQEAPVSLLALALERNWTCHPG